MVSGHQRGKYFKMPVIFGFLRSKLGPKLVIVNLVMEPEELRKRVLARHQGDEEAADMMEVIVFSSMINMDKE